MPLPLFDFTKKGIKKGLKKRIPKIVWSFNNSRNYQNTVIKETATHMMQTPIPYQYPYQWSVKIYNDFVKYADQISP